LSIDSIVGSISVRSAERRERQLLQIASPKDHEHQAQGMLGASVEIRSLSKSYGAVAAAENVSFSIERGEFVSLLGPSGSGKTTVLMAIAGFLRPTSGEIHLGGRNIVALSANRRNIGMVFQKYALFPHMSVARNVAFPLEMRGWAKPRIRASVEKILDVVQLSQFADRLPAQLSGGQQQRVALARSIVFEPPLLLMDEPLGALDKKLRESLQIEIKRLQQELGITVLFVTHDQSEALAMSDRIVVMNEGRVEQVGTPQDLYRDPSSLFVADFIGSSNFFRGKRYPEADNLLHYGSVSLKGTSKDKVSRRAEPSALMVRPEKIDLRPLAPTSDANAAVSGIIHQIVFEGANNTFVIMVGSQEVRVTKPAGERPSFLVGETVALSWSPDDALIFNSAEMRGTAR
jgi:spermidine/putrescine ABC transporter ATP-binding subunit